MNVPSPAMDFDRRQAKDEIKASRVKALSEEYAVGAALPMYVLTEEKPVHITMAYMMAAGRTRKEVAEATGFTPAQVTMVSKQPFFKKRLKEITEAAGKDMVKQFLEGEVMPSLELLCEVRDNSEERGSTRVIAANSILDRFMGKPTIHVDSKTNLNIQTAATAKDQVQAELDRINLELRERGVAQSRN